MKWQNIEGGGQVCVPKDRELCLLSIFPGPGQRRQAGGDLRQGSAVAGTRRHGSPPLPFQLG